MTKLSDFGYCTNLPTTKLELPESRKNAALCALQSDFFGALRMAHAHAKIARKFLRIISHLKLGTVQ